MTITQMAQMNSSNGVGSAYSKGNNAKLQNEISKFQKLLDSNLNAQANNTDVSSNQFIQKGRLNGDYTSGFEIENPTELDKFAKPQGFAANNPLASGKTIDKTSELYKNALEFENYFVKIMLSSMRNTIQKSSLGGNDSFASKIYEDMMYDELSVSMTKNAGFGLADQIYLSLSSK